MKKALISPEEMKTLGVDTVTIDNSIVSGARVVQIEDVAFDVAEPLFWVDCPDHYIQQDCVYTNGEVVYSPRVVIDLKALNNLNS